MLTPEQIQQIPRTTRNDWKQFSHNEYYGYELAKNYIDDFDHIKTVLTNKHLKFGMKMLCSMSAGYKDLLSSIEKSKKLMRENALQLTTSIELIARKGNVSIKKASALFGVSKAWYYRHRTKKTCEKSILNKCFKQYPNQLAFEEVNTIEQIISKPENRGKTKATLYYDSMRKGLIACGRTAFSKYANLLGYLKYKKEKNENRQKGFKATRPFEWLHVDVTHIQTVIDGTQYVAFVKDNFSGALLGYNSASIKPNSSFIRDLFIQVFTEYNLLEKQNAINILSDGGSENKGSLLEWINQLEAPPLVKKLTAKTDEFPFSNSMSESTHSIYKSEFMKGKFSYNQELHRLDIERFIAYYNHERYPCRHFGLTVTEVLNGQLSNPKRFTQQIKEAKPRRIEQNRKFNNCPFICFSK